MEFQAITPIVAEDGAGGSSGGLSDATKLVIMLSMGTLLLVIAVVNLHMETLSMTYLQKYSKNERVKRLQKWILI